MNIFLKTPKAIKEQVQEYRFSSKELANLPTCYRNYSSTVAVLPRIQTGKRFSQGQKNVISPPHVHQYVIGYFYQGSDRKVRTSIKTALSAKKSWESTLSKERASVFLKAATLAAEHY